jgi:hypothetical protein
MYGCHQVLANSAGLAVSENHPNYLCICIYDVCMYVFRHVCMAGIKYWPTQQAWAGLKTTILSLHLHI